MTALYDEVVDLWRTSVLTNGGVVQTETTLTELRESGIPLLVEFEKDIDIQYMKICSTNYGMIRTYQKRFLKKEK
jgi:hypothetical protein